MMAEPFNESEFGTDKNLDRNNLELEAERIANLYSKYAFRAANARAEKDNAEDALTKLTVKFKIEVERASAELEKIHATIGLEIRKDPKSFGLSEKPTEATVESQIQTDARYIAQRNKTYDAKGYILTAEYQEALKRLRDATEHLEWMDEAKESMLIKRSGLKHLSDLWLGGYWTTEIRMGTDATEMARKSQREGLKNPTT